MFRQSVVISIVVALHLIPSINEWDEGKVATMIQNMLICLEMFLFSVLHLWAFPYDLYKVDTQSQKPLIHTVELGRTCNIFFLFQRKLAGPIFAETKRKCCTYLFCNRWSDEKCGTFHESIRHGE